MNIEIIDVKTIYYANTLWVVLISLEELFNFCITNQIYFCLSILYSDFSRFFLTVGKEDRNVIIFPNIHK